MAVVEGEAGIGKTRLLDEFTAQVSSVGAPALVVRCYPGEEALAYAPIADALRTTNRPLRDIAETVVRSCGRDGIDERPTR